MTYAEFAALPEQPGLQLIDGYLVKEPSGTYGHQAAVGNLYWELQTLVRKNGLGRVIVAPFDVVLGDTQVLQPDVLFISHQRLSWLREKGLFGAPDLAVEVLSRSTRRYDLGRKRELYLEHGCRELWIADVQEMIVDQHVSAAGEWRMDRLIAGDHLTSQVLPTLDLPVAAIFADSLT